MERAGDAGYDTLLLTVDVPQVSRRVRDQRNGFNVPFRLTPTSFLDFVTHPRWSLSTLAAGIPSPKNIGRGDSFVRDASRAGADWDFLAKLRKTWKGNLIVKGITSAWDAVRVRDAGADAVYVSNHGGRQLDSVPAAIDLLARIRTALGADMPLLFDSGVRNGEDVVKALALGADFVMLGRPVLFALGAGGEKGLSTLLNCFVQDTDAAIAQLGVSSVADLWAGVLFEPDSDRGEETSNSSPAAQDSGEELKGDCSQNDAGQAGTRRCFVGPRTERKGRGSCFHPGRRFLQPGTRRVHGMSDTGDQLSARTGRGTPG